MSCDSTDPELLARTSRFLWDTPLERAATSLVCIAVPSVLLAWTQFSSWHCHCRWGVHASRAAGVAASVFYTVARAMYISAPWELSLSSGIVVTNLVLSMVVGVIAFYDSTVALSFVLCPSRMATSVELQHLTGGGKPLYTPPPATNPGRFFRALAYKALFLIVLALDIHVRCGTVVFVLGWLAWSICAVLWVLSYQASQSFPAPRPKHDDVKAKPNKRGGARRVPCVNLTAHAALACCAGAFAIPVLVLRPYSGY